MRAPVLADMKTLVALTVVCFAGALLSLPSAPGTGDFVLKALVAGAAIFALMSRLRTPFPLLAFRLVGPYLLFIALAAASALYYSGSPVYAAAALQPFLLGMLLYFVLVVTLTSAEWDGETLRRLFYAIVVVQFAFALLKLAVHGIDEKVFIGTMSHNAGQLGFLFPAIVIPILVYLQRPGNVLWIWLLIACMLAFGIINEKRSVIFALPLILLASIVANGAGGHLRSGAQRALLIAGFLVIAIVGVIAGVALIPSLNEAEAYGGGVSLVYVLSYTLDYLTMDYGGGLQGTYAQAVFDENIQVGRLILWLQTVEWIMESPWPVAMLGTGFGSATPSGWIAQGSDPLFDLLGTRGAISGAGLALVETGLLGFTLLAAFFVYLFLATFRAQRRATIPAARYWLRTTLIIQAVFWYDFFFYSTVLFRTLPMPFIVFGVAASVVYTMRMETARR